MEMSQIVYGKEPDCGRKGEADCGWKMSQLGTFHMCKLREM